MTQAATIHPLVGSAPIGNWFIPDTTQRHPLGTILDYIDPFYGGGEAIYLQAPASVALEVGSVVVYSLTGPYIASLVANDASQGGASLAFALNAVASSASAQFFWAAIAGSTPVRAASDVAAGAALGIAGVGQAGAIAAGKQILSAESVGAFATTVVKTNVQTQSGSAVIKASNADGWWVGMTMTGTGITGTITGIDADNRLVTLSANATATGSVTVTGTFTNRIRVQHNRPMAQGQIV